MLTQKISGTLVAVTVFTASGTWTKNARANAILLEVQGAGGAGAGFTAGTQSGAPGGAGVFAMAFNAAPPASAAVTIGAGGAGAGTDGAAGGSTILAGIMTAAGGPGGRTQAPYGAHCIPGGGQGGALPQALAMSANGAAAAANTGAGGAGAADNLATTGRSGGSGGSGYLTVWEFEQ